MTILNPWFTVTACDGGVPNKPHTMSNLISPLMATAILKRLGGHREKRDQVYSIELSEGGMSAHCYAKNNEHLADISWRPTREGWFISG